MKNTMKKAKLWKRILTAALISVMVLASVPVQAVQLPKSKTITLYSGKTSKNQFYQNVWLGFLEGDSGNVKLSNSSVAKASLNYGSVYVIPKKAGKTVLTVKDAEGTSKCNLTVKKYVNPVASVKIGNTTISGSKFNKEAYRAVTYSKFANKKVKVTFNLKKGWTIGKLSYLQSTWMKSEDVNNGSVIPVKGGKGFKVLTTATNDKTGQEIQLYLWFK